MTKAYDVLIERDSDGYFIASVPELPGCHTLPYTGEVIGHSDEACA
jgi:predicted RNase H-like HicB family nuclease